MNILEHPVHQDIYDLCQEIEKLPASEQATKCVVMASNLHRPCSALVSDNRKLREVVEWIASQQNLFFAECSQAEEIVSRCRKALPSPKPWPKEGDRVRVASGKEGDVLENINGRVKVDWGLYITIHDAAELEWVE